VAQGKAPPDPLLQSDVDLLQHFELIEAIGAGATIEAGDPLQALTAQMIARVVEAAVEQHREDLPKGKIGGFKARAQALTERALAGSSFIAGARFQLGKLKNAGAIGDEALEHEMAYASSCTDKLRREIASQSAQILREIIDAKSRKGKSGRPSGSKGGDEVAKLIDAQILLEAAQRVSVSVIGRDDVATQIPIIVREYVRQRFLHPLGTNEHEQEAVDRHSKRITRRLDDLIKTSERRVLLNAAVLRSRLNS